MSPRGGFIISMQVVPFCCLQLQILGELVPSETGRLRDFLQLLEMTRIQFEIFGPGD